MSYIGNQPTSVAFLTDQFNGTGSQTAFTMSVAPANTASVLVSVSGVLQDPSTYSVAGTTLTFSAAPPSGTGNVSARYLGIPASGIATTAYRTVTEFTATASQTTFTPPSYTAGFINVYRNGVRLGAADYTATNGTTVVLASGATAGDLVTTESYYVSSVLNAIPATAGAINLTSAAYISGILPVANGGTGNAGGAWTAYTPVITASTGSFTTVSATGYYQVIGKTCFVSVNITITTVGSASGLIYATLPFTSAARIQIGGWGMETSSTGNMLKGYIPASTNQLQWTTYSNGFTIGAGYTPTMNVVYEIA